MERTSKTVFGFEVHLERRERKNIKALLTKKCPDEFGAFKIVLEAAERSSAIPVQVVASIEGVAAVPSGGKNGNGHPHRKTSKEGTCHRRCHVLAFH